MKLDRIHRGVRACVLLMFAYSALGLGVLALFGGKLSLLFLDSAESAAVRDQIGLLAQQFLVWNASCYFLLTLVNVLRFLIQGVGFTQQAVFAGVFETIARCFVGFAVVRWSGYTAICLANPAAWAAGRLLSSSPSTSTTCIFCSGASRSAAQRLDERLLCPYNHPIENRKGGPANGPSLCASARLH